MSVTRFVTDSRSQHKTSRFSVFDSETSSSILCSLGNVLQSLLLLLQRWFYRRRRKETFVKRKRYIGKSDVTFFSSFVFSSLEMHRFSLSSDLKDSRDTKGQTIHYRRHSRCHSRGLIFSRPQSVSHRCCCRHGIKRRCSSWQKLHKTLSTLYCFFFFDKIYTTKKTLISDSSFLAVSPADQASRHHLWLHIPLSKVHSLSCRGLSNQGSRCWRIKCSVEEEACVFMHDSLGPIILTVDEEDSRSKTIESEAAWKLRERQEDSLTWLDLTRREEVHFTTKIPSQWALFHVLRCFQCKRILSWTSKHRLYSRVMKIGRHKKRDHRLQMKTVDENCVEKV